MKLKALIFSLMSLGLSSHLFATEITPNTESFNLSNYFYKDPNSPDMSVYNVAGFYQKNTPLINQRIFLLPQIIFNKNNISFISKRGSTISDIDQVTVDNLAKIKIQLNYNGNMPTKEQAIGIASQLSGTSMDTIAPFHSFHFSSLTPQINSIDMITSHDNKGLFNARYKERQNKIDEQNKLYDTFNKTHPEVVAINNLYIRVLLDGEVVGERQVSATTIPGNKLPDIYISNLDEYKLNRFKERGFEIQVDYSFKDLHSGTISAETDYTEVMNTLIEQSRHVENTSSSGGWQFLGFGHRKTQFKQIINDKLNETHNSSKSSNTVIQMDDASSDMIDVFNARFFPTISKSDLIEKHEQAALKAQAEGNQALYKAEMNYLNDVKADKPDLTVDTKEAIKALKNNDYVSFIANGLKIGKNDSSGNYDYVKVLSFREGIDDRSKWVYQQNFSTQRSITQLIPVTEQYERRPYLGLCDFNTAVTALPEVVNDQLLPPINKTYLALTCIEDNSPLVMQGITPGALIRSIGGKTVHNINEYNDIVSQYKPGKDLPVTIMRTNGQFWAEQRIWIPLGKGRYKND